MVCLTRWMCAIKKWKTIQFVVRIHNLQVVCGLYNNETVDPDLALN